MAAKGQARVAGCRRPAAAASRRRLPRRRAGFPAARPEDEGLAAGPLAALRAAVQREVGIGALAGAAHIVLRNGLCVLAHADGWADKAKGQRFGMRTICRLHGCTKPLVAAAFLTLVDGGRVKLTDPVDKYIAFSDEVALSGKGGARAPKVRKARAKPTLRHLLTMTAGLKYEHCPAYAKVMRQIRRGEVRDLAGMCAGLAEAPLQFQPGSRYEYSFSTDVLGRVCEAASGQRLDKFMEAALFRPLGMRDTHFEVPSRKRSRLSVLYDCQPLPASKRARGGLAYALVRWDHPESAPGIMSGGGGILSYKDPGLLSTVQDYARFCQMLLEGGRAPGGGAQVLRPATVRALWADGLAPYGGRGGRLPGWHDAGARGGMWDHTGWSLLNTHLTLKDKPRVPGSNPRVGDTMWMGGGGGTYWVIDPARRLASLSFTQSFGGGPGTDAAKDAAQFAAAAVDTGATLR